METFLSLRCKDAAILVNDGRRVLVSFLTEENDEVFCWIFPNIQRTYPNLKITKEFIERVIYKIKISLSLKSKELDFVKVDKFLRLVTNLSSIYDVIHIFPTGAVSLDNPLLVDCKCLDMYNEAGKYFIIAKLELKLCNLRTVVMRVDSEIFELFKNPVVKENISKKYKRYSREVVAEYLSDFLHDKSLKVEYSEHKGFTLWTMLETFFEE